jgi:hypothetical protein
MHSGSKLIDLLLVFGPIPLENRQILPLMSQIFYILDFKAKFLTYLFRFFRVKSKKVALTDLKDEFFLKKLKKSIFYI